MTLLKWFLLIFIFSLIILLDVLFRSACRDLVKSGELEKEPDRLISTWKSMDLIEAVLRSKSKSRSVLAFRRLFIACLAIGVAFLSFAFVPEALR
jgi:hypothetical protein